MVKKKVKRIKSKSKTITKKKIFHSTKVKLSAKDFLRLKNPIIALVGEIIFLVGFLISIILYNNYSFGMQFISELGVGTTSIIFNSCIIIAPILMIPFFFFSKGKNNISQIASLLGIASAFFLMGVGLFPLTFSNMHLFFAGMFFFSSALTALFFSFYYLISAFEIKQINLFILFLSFIGFCSFIIIVIFLLFFRDPLWQKISVFVFFLWLLFFIIGNYFRCLSK